MTTTITSPPEDIPVECRVLVHADDAYLLCPCSGRWYGIEDEEFAERCRQLGGGAPMDATVYVRRVQSTEHSTGGFNYPPHQVGSSEWSIPLIVVGHERESFQVTGPGVGQQLLGQQFEGEVK
jgi:hypothetical protein